MKAPKNIVFLDAEADNVTANSKFVTYLLELSAIKINQDNIIETFNEFSYREKISKRISNLLAKPENYYQNPKFKSEDQIYQQFLNFVNDAKIYAFGVFDQMILNQVCKRNNHLDLNKIEINDLQPFLTKKLKVSKNTGLSTFALILDIEFEKLHDSLTDAKLLHLIYSKVSSNDFNINHYLERIQLINFLPRITSPEFIDFTSKTNANLIDDFEIVIIEKQEVTISVVNNVSLDEYEDVAISYELINELNKSIDNISNIKIWKFSKNNLNFIESINDKNWKENLKLKLFFENNKNNLFITNSNSVISYASQTLNHQLHFLNSKKVNCDFNNLNSTNMNNLSVKIKKAINLFKRKFY